MGGGKGNKVAVGTRWGEVARRGNMYVKGSETFGGRWVLLNGVICTLVGQGHPKYIVEGTGVRDRRKDTSLSTYFLSISIGKTFEIDIMQPRHIRQH